MARALLEQGRSPLLKGFASKSGRPFDARLKLEGGEVRFDFAP
jgi:DNA topoisomerase-3